MSPTYNVRECEENKTTCRPITQIAEEIFLNIKNCFSHLIFVTLLHM